MRIFQKDSSRNLKRKMSGKLHLLNLGKSLWVQWVGKESKLKHLFQSHQEFSWTNRQLRQRETIYLQDSTFLIHPKTPGRTNSNVCCIITFLKRPSNIHKKYREPYLTLMKLIMKNQLPFKLIRQQILIKKCLIKNILK